MKKYVKEETEYDFYKCLKCGRLITFLQQKEKADTGRICKCGGLKYSPVNPKRYQFLLPHVVRFAIYRVMGWA